MVSMVEPSQHHLALSDGGMLAEYRIERVLGVSGFSITYLAIAPDLDRPVAIEEYLPNDIARRHGTSVRPRSTAHDGEYRRGRDQFLSTARALTEISHPNIVRALRVFEAHNTAYLVMEHEVGERLDIRLAHNDDFDEGELRRITTALLAGLEALSKAARLHGSIEPSAIQLRPDGSPVLMNLAASRAAVTRQGRHLAIGLAPGYAAIEQYTGRAEQGPRTDIYALGAVLYRIVSGRDPVDAPARVLEDEQFPASRLAVGRYSRKFLRAIDAAMAVRPEDRPQSLAEWREMLAAPAVTERPAPAASAGAAAGRDTSNSDLHASRDESEQDWEAEGASWRQIEWGRYIPYGLGALASVGVIAAVIGAVGSDRYREELAFGRQMTQRLEQQRLADAERLFGPLSGERLTPPQAAGIERQQAEGRPAEAADAEAAAAQERRQSELAAQQERERQEVEIRAAEAKVAEERRQRDIAAQRERERQQAEAKAADEKRQREIAAQQERDRQQADAKAAEERRQRELAAQQERERQLAEAKAAEEQRQRELATQRERERQQAEARAAEEKRQREIAAQQQRDRQQAEAKATEERRQREIAAQQERERQQAEARAAEERRQREIGAQRERERQQAEARAAEERRQRELAAQQQRERQQAEARAAEERRQREIAAQQERERQQAEARAAEARAVEERQRQESEARAAAARAAEEQRVREAAEARQRELASAGPAPRSEPLSSGRLLGTIGPTSGAPASPPPAIEMSLLPPNPPANDGIGALIRSEGLAAPTDAGNPSASRVASATAAPRRLEPPAIVARPPSPPSPQAPAAAPSAPPTPANRAVPIALPRAPGEVGRVDEINLGWGYVVLRMDSASSVRIGDRVYARAGIEKLWMTVRRINGSQVSATPDADLRRFTSDLRVFKD